MIADPVSRAKPSIGMPVARATPPATEANLGICLKQGGVGHGTSEIGFGSAREAEIGHAQARQVCNEPDYIRVMCSVRK